MPFLFVVASEIRCQDALPSRIMVGSLFFYSVMDLA